MKKFKTAVAVIVIVAILGCIALKNDDLYSGHNPVTNCRVEFGETYFYIPEGIQKFATGDSLSLSQMADYFGYSISHDVDGGWSDDEPMFVKDAKGTTVMMIGGDAGNNLPYLKLYVDSERMRSVEIKFLESSDRSANGFRIENGSRIPWLMANMIEFALDSAKNYSFEIAERFRRLEEQGVSAPAEIVIK